MNRCLGLKLSKERLQGPFLFYGALLIGDMEERVIPDVMNHVFLPQGRYPEKFVWIFQLEVGQEGGGLQGGYLEDVEGS